MIVDIGSNLRYVLFGAMIVFLIERWWSYRTRRISR